MKNSLNCRQSEKGYVAIVPMLFAMVLLAALGYIALAPFEPISFFSIGAIAVVGGIWAVIYLIRREEKDGK